MHSHTQATIEEEEGDLVPEPSAAKGGTSCEWLSGSDGPSTATPLLPTALDVTDADPDADHDATRIGERPRGLSVAQPTASRPRMLTVKHVSRAAPHGDKDNS